VKLTLGSGTHPTRLPGWLNLDGYADGAHVRADAYQMPFRAGVFDAVYLGHFLEHVWWDDLPVVGAEIRRVLSPGAAVMVVGPDIARAVAQGEPRFILDAIISDGHLPPGGHAWIPTEALTVRAVAVAGFTDVAPVDVATVERPEWPNPTTAAWQCAVRASSGRPAPGA
jgi:SAM-dependent methyltransferase